MTVRLRKSFSRNKQYPKKSKKPNHPDRVAFLLEKRMTRVVMTKEEVLATIHECAAQIGHVPSFPELTKLTKVRRRAIFTHFGTYTKALRACGLERSGPGYEVSPHELFLDWASVARGLGMVPSMGDYGLKGRYSVRPFLRCYRGWRHVTVGMLEYAKKEGLEGEWSDVLDIITRFLETGGKRGWTSGAGMEKPKIALDEPLYGVPLMHPALSHAPTNEMGVLFLFGTLAQELGYKVMRVQAAFPDCEAMRRVEPERWQRVRIEFEFESRNFLAHMHPPAHCDLIVCWSHNWKECPVEVLELRKVVMGQEPKK
jgi:Homing endonuclease associated repeat